MNLVKDLWSHLKEWSDWKMKDWIKAGIVAIIVIVVLTCSSDTRIFSRNDRTYSQGLCCLAITPGLLQTSFIYCLLSKLWH